MTQFVPRKNCYDPSYLATLPVISEGELLALNRLGVSHWTQRPVRLDQPNWGAISLTLTVLLLTTLLALGLRL